MKLFFDHNLSPKIAAALRPLVEPDGHTAQALSERYKHGKIDDVTWINDLAREGGWAVVTYDLRIKRNAHERAAWRRANLTTFFLGQPWRKQPASHPRETAARLLLWWPRLVQQFEEVEGGAYELPLRHASKLKALQP